MTDKQDLRDVLLAVQQQFTQFGGRFPDGFDSRVFRWVDDALAAPPAQPAEPQGWKCQIAEADFEQNTVTLLMAGDDYQVSAGPHMLAPLVPLLPRATK